MKLNDSSKIIGTDDIFVSSNNSQIGKDLSEILAKLDSDILDLKKNVKWLYKYGGVGGSGGGSSASSTKISCTIAYTNTAGKEVQAKITEGSIFNILKGSYITISCTITSKKSLPEYKMTLAGESITIKATDIAGVKKLIPTGNTAYTLTVIGETTVSLDFSVFTDILSISSKILLANGISIVSNQAMYGSNIEGANYVFLLINYQPSSFASSIKTLTVNNQTFENIDNYITESIDIDGAKTTTLKIPASEIFLDFDIYTFEVDYTFGSDTNSCTSLFIYQSEAAFVYCYANVFNVYKSPTDNPVSTNSYNNTINYKIYLAKDDSATKQYNLSIKVGDKTVTQVVNSGTVYNYTITNNSKSETPTQVEIRFSLDDTTYSYYIYLVKPEDVSYIFEDNGVKFYLAVSCDTEDTNTSIIEFPEKDPLLGGIIQINKELSFTLKTTCRNCGSLLLEHPENTIVSDFIKSSGLDLNYYKCDALFSFGLKYGGSNYNTPIVTITSNNASSITLYKNKMTFSMGTSTEKVCLPNDGDFHLILLYFKAEYSTSLKGSTSLVVALFVDGVLEITPFTIDNFYIENKTSITYHVGLWVFDHIGVATFNCGFPSEYRSTALAIDKYLLDFDPFIPANYYLSYLTKLRKINSSKFDKYIYTNFDRNSGGIPLWINYFGYDKESAAHLQKFVSISPSVLEKLAPNIEIYRIIPESTHLSEGYNPVPDKHLNLFVYNTLTSYGESANLKEISCSFLKWTDNGFVDLISNEDAEDNVSFSIKYQGSSTLLYSCKNFEISANPIVDLDGTSRNVYFTPDVNLFPKLEQSFNLKADLVDSSHSNNVVIGNFVNDYMASPFNTTERKYKSCLTGKPILLFILNNARDEETGLTIYDSSDLFLGIYSLNLNRGSVNNLGYSRLMKNDTEEIEIGNDLELLTRCCDRITKFHILADTERIDTSNNFAVAEILGNGILYDWSQFDYALLANEVLGDFYVKDGTKISKEFSKVFIKPFKALAQIIYSYILEKKYFNCIDYSSIFTTNELANPETYYYYDDDNVKSIPENSIIISSNTLNNLSDPLPYRSYEEINGLKISKINNPLYQFHVVCNDKGQPINNNNIIYYYMEKLGDLSYESENPPAYIDITSAVKYYIVCMAFAMVDSVLKNLTIKCPNTLQGNGSIWYPAFYDMDTAFGISNSGGETSFLAFSDWVNSDNSITQDYVDKDAGSGYYDTPSSFLFLYAKYLDILSGCSFSNTTEGIFPYEEWAKLRDTNGSFSSGSAFCEKYIDNYFGNINPIIWNLNYLYKYFSITFNGETDTEISRFNGTRRFARKEYLNSRFKYLDVLFGHKNAANIGTSTSTITYGLDTMSKSKNSDIKANRSMFPKFTKGVVGSVRAEITEQPKTPIVLQLSTNNSKLYLTDSTGSATVSGTITSNTDVGFYGTLELISVSDCGQFLINTSEENSITNNVIKDIIINKSLSTKNTSLMLDLANITSAETITISSGTILYYNTIVIKNSNNNLTFNLSKIKLNNIYYNTLYINNVNVNDLSITNCEGGTITLEKINIAKFTYSNTRNTNVIFNLVTLNDNFEFTDLACISFKDSNSNLKQFTLIPNSNLNTLTLSGGSYSKFYVTQCSKLTNLTVSSINCSYFWLNSGDFSETQSQTVQISGKLTLGFANTNTYVLLKIPHFSKITELSLGKVTTCDLPNYALYGCSALKSLPSNVTFKITGYGALGKTISLQNKELINVNTTNLSKTFIYCTDINLEFVTKWFKAHANDKVKATILNSMFCGTGIEQVCNGTLTEEYLEFEDAFVKYCGNNNKVTYDLIFYLTNFNIITKNFVNCGSTSQLNSPAGKGGLLLYIEKLALNNIENVIISGGYINGAWSRSSFKVFEREDDGITVLDQIRMSDCFDNDCKVKTLEYFNPYNTKTEPFDFEGGFPKSITSVGMFRYTSYCYITNFLNAFNNISTCIFKQGSFNKSSATDTFKLDSLPNLYETLVKTTTDSNGLEVHTLKVTLEQNYYADDGSYAFWSTCTAEQFKIIISLLSSSTTLNYILLKTVVTDADSNILEYLLYPFKNLIYAFKDCVFEDSNGDSVALDLTNVFKEKSEDKVNKSISNMSHCFLSCHLKRLEQRLNIKSLEDLSYCFYDVSWENNLSGETIEIWQPNDFPTIPVYTDSKYTILPDNFFAICGACNLNSCFGASEYKSTNLYGYIPKEDTLGLTTALSKATSSNNIFSNALIIYYNKIENTGNFYIFPLWYNKLNFYNKYNVFIPTSPKLLLEGSGSSNIVYLFENNILYGSYGTLPLLPTRRYISSAYTWIILAKDEDRSTHILMPYPNCSGLPLITGANYKNIIPYTLALILNLGVTGSEVIEGFSTISDALKEQSKPVCLLTAEPDNSTSAKYVFGGDGTDTSSVSDNVVKYIFNT